MVDYTIDESGGAGSVGEDGRPVAEREIGGEHDALFLVPATHDLEQQIGVAVVEGEKPDRVEDKQVNLGVVFEPAIDRARGFPGIMAKPVIDIMVVVAKIAEAPTFFDPLERLQYHYFPYTEGRTPERRWFFKPNGSERTHRVHLFEAGIACHDAVLAFRDFLRTNRDEAARYESLKRTLAARFPNDREAYTEGKTEFIRGVFDALSTFSHLDPGEDRLVGFRREKMLFMGRVR